VVTDRADEPLDNAVTDEATVAVLEERHPLDPWRDDERRVADDEVEPLTDHGFQEAAAAQVELEPGQSRVEPRIVEGALGHVRRDESAAVACEVQRLHAAPRPQVEGALNRCPARGRRPNDPA